MNGLLSQNQLENFSIDGVKKGQLPYTLMTLTAFHGGTIDNNEKIEACITDHNGNTHLFISDPTNNKLWYYVYDKDRNCLNITNPFTTNGSSIYISNILLIGNFLYVFIVDTNTVNYLYKFDVTNFTKVNSISRTGVIVKNSLCTDGQYLYFISNNKTTAITYKNYINKYNLDLTEASFYQKLTNTSMLGMQVTNDYLYVIVNSPLTVLKLDKSTFSTITTVSSPSSKFYLSNGYLFFIWSATKVVKFDLLLNNISEYLLAAGTDCYGMANLDMLIMVTENSTQYIKCINYDSSSVKWRYPYLSNQEIVFNPKTNILNAIYLNGYYNRYATILQL